MPNKAPPPGKAQFPKTSTSPSFMQGFAAALQQITSTVLDTANQGLQGAIDFTKDTKSALDPILKDFSDIGESVKTAASIGAILDKGEFTGPIYETGVGMQAGSKAVSGGLQNLEEEFTEAQKTVQGISPNKAGLKPPPKRKKKRKKGQQRGRPQSIPQAQTSSASRPSRQGRRRH